MAATARDEMERMKREVGSGEIVGEYTARGFTEDELERHLESASALITKIEECIRDFRVLVEDQDGIIKGNVTRPVAGGVAGAGAGAATGAGVGAAIGTSFPIPLVGTAVGAGIGLLAGAIGGGISRAVQKSNAEDERSRLDGEIAELERFRKGWQRYKGLLEGIKEKCKAVERKREVDEQQRIQTNANNAKHFFGIFQKGSSNEGSKGVSSSGKLDVWYGGTLDDVKHVLQEGGVKTSKLITEAPLPETVKTGLIVENNSNLVGGLTSIFDSMTDTYKKAQVPLTKYLEEKQAQDELIGKKLVEAVGGDEEATSFIAQAKPIPCPEISDATLTSLKQHFVDSANKFVSQVEADLKKKIDTQEAIYHPIPPKQAAAMLPPNAMPPKAEVPAPKKATVHGK
ncbi:MAG: hypothetical protein LBJ09_02015 [Clostridiales bacterium]|jgi:hypothetical protein|nr:hypothetical protein [Clostridiales bacterium]